MIRMQALAAKAAAAAILPHIDDRESLPILHGAHLYPGDGLLIATDRRTAASYQLMTSPTVGAALLEVVGDETMAWIPRAAVAWIAELQLDSRPKRSMPEAWMREHFLLELDVMDSKLVVRHLFVMPGRSELIAEHVFDATIGGTSPVDIRKLFADWRPSSRPAAYLDPTLLERVTTWSRRYRKTGSGRAATYEQVVLRTGEPSMLIDAGRLVVLVSA